MKSSIIASGSETVHELPIDPIAYGLIAFVILITLLGITFAFRNFGSKND